MKSIPLETHFEKYFSISLADTESLKEQVYRIRYEVYCKEFDFEPAENFPFTIPAGTPFELTTSQRTPLFVPLTKTGTYPVSFEYRHWITGKLLGVAKTQIKVL